MTVQTVLTIVPESIISVTRLITRSKAGSVCRVPEIFTMMEVVPLRKMDCCHPHDDNDDIFYDKTAEKMTEIDNRHAMIILMIITMMMVMIMMPMTCTMTKWAKGSRFLAASTRCPSNSQDTFARLVSSSSLLPSSSSSPPS